MLIVLDYVNQVVFIHQEVIIPKYYMPLSKVSAFIVTLNGNKLPDNVVH